MELEAIYAKSRAILGDTKWAEICGRGPVSGSDPEAIPLRLAESSALGRFPAFLADLAALEWAVHAARSEAHVPDGETDEPILNPTLSLVNVHWKNLADFVTGDAQSRRAPEAGDEHLLVWRMAHTGEVRVSAATPEDLLVLKMVDERIDARTIAAAGDLPLRAVHASLDRACVRGLLVSPSTKIARGSDFIADGSGAFMRSGIFTLQWHLTRRCDLSCRHCYDRTERRELPLERCLEVLDDFSLFCGTKRVRGAVTFTGGNPLLYPHFTALYRAAVDHGFAIAILGNPTERAFVEQLVDIGSPDFFQVSLEGLEAHNDFMRGSGHFRRTMAFLDVLRDLGVYSMVMLTLTEANMDEVISLAQHLQGKADVFHFNRLSRSGAGADLNLPPRDRYRSFLREYLAASKECRIMGLKDNLLNLVLAENGEAPFGGCTGFGCGAAFNFVTLLPDGEVHACRKFHSPIGNILHASMAEIYDSQAAAQYRQRPAACRGCSLRAACGGCLAVVQTLGLDISKDRDPMCFSRVTGAPRVSL